MKVITAGSAYLDIDAYAGIIAYAELLQKQGFPAQAVSTAAPNESVTKSVRSWPVSLKTEYEPRPDDTFTLIDISTPEYFDTFVDHDRIDAVIDHHPGYETYWQEKIGDGTNIEPIGAACTQVYEYWKRAGLVDEMSETSACLLVCGILDNTLNFGAKINTNRDEGAYEDLMRIANLPSDWPAQYFGECQEAIDKDPVQAIQKDTKTVQFPGRENNVRVGQFAVWDATEVLGKFQANLLKHFEAQDTPWFINIISIGERKSYFLSSDPEMQQWLAELLNVTFDGSIAVADRLWLRKEIIQAAIDYTN
jgi:inorganic pyrophosphatase/exopolyphosphatase